MVGTVAATFEDRIRSGGWIEPDDDMPDAYRSQVIRVVGFQALAEVVGTLLFTEWMCRAPSLERKLILTAKVQDEMGHGHILMRVCEDLGRPREAIIEEFLAGKTKLLNIFHYGIDTWDEVGIAALLQNSAAIVQFRSLVQGSYGPYVRALRKIMKEESFHHYHALELTQRMLAEGTPEQRAGVQRGLAKWWPRLIAYFGPPDTESEHTAQAMAWRIKVHTNDDLRQQWIAKMVPLLTGMGLEIPDPALRQEEDGRWTFTAPDWAEVKRVITEGGPRTDYYREILARTYRRDGWVRDVTLARVA